MSIPFTPGFGEKPYILIGRESIIDDYDDVLFNEDKTFLKHPLIVGPRAIGKTVLLHRLLEIAGSYGYMTAYISTQADMYNQLLSDLHGMSFATNTGSKIEINPQFSVSTPAGGFSLSGLKFEKKSDEQFFDIDLATIVCDIINEKKASGVAIAIDEMNIEFIDDIRKIATTMQTLISNGFPVSFIGAGIPEYIDEIKQDKSISFIRRMCPKDIGNLSLTDIADGIEKACYDNDIEIDKNVGMTIAKASDGSPFIAQLFSYGACVIARRRAIRNGDNVMHVSIDDCYNGFESKLPDVFKCIVIPTFNSLTNVEKTFIEAMSSVYPEVRVPMKTIVSYMGETKQYVNIYKKRLIDKKIIIGDGYGCVKCIVPYMTMYVENQERYSNIGSDDKTEIDNDPTSWTRVAKR